MNKKKIYGEKEEEEVIQPPSHYLIRLSTAVNHTVNLNIECQCEVAVCLIATERAPISFARFSILNINFSYFAPLASAHGTFFFIRCDRRCHFLAIIIFARLFFLSPSISYHLLRMVDPWYAVFSFFFFVCSLQMDFFLSFDFSPR